MRQCWIKRNLTAKPIERSLGHSLAGRRKIHLLDHFACQAVDSGSAKRHSNRRRSAFQAAVEGHIPGPAGTGIKGDQE
jgi:hypothetical protein